MNISATEDYNIKLPENRFASYKTVKSEIILYLAIRSKCERERQKIEIYNLDAVYSRFSPENSFPNEPRN